jgi:hypothetical protein
MQPQEVRDIAIECMGRLGSTVASVKESCPESFFRPYLSACGVTMGGFVVMINEMVRDHPELNPSEEEWIRVATERRRVAPPPAGLRGLKLAYFEVEAVAMNMQRLRTVNDHSLSPIIDDIDAQLLGLRAMFTSNPAV